MNNILIINKQILSEIIQEEYKSLLKEERINKLYENYNKLSTKEQIECKILAVKFYSDLYESKLINEQQIKNLLLLEQEEEKQGFLGKIASNAKDMVMMGGPVGFILKKLGVVDSPLDMLKLILDVLGFFPGFGEIADLINLCISLLEKDLVGVALNAVSLIPTLGDAIAKPIKWLLKAKKALPLKYVQKIIPALKQHGPQMIVKLKQFLQKIPFDNTKKQKLINIAEKALKTAEDFFAKNISGSADDIAKNLGNKAAARLKAEKDRYNREKAAEREAEREASGRVTAGQVAGNVRDVTNRFRQMRGRRTTPIPA